MIGVNTFCAPIVTMVNRQPVSYAEAVRRYRELVPVDQPNTVDPAVEPRGKRYDFSDERSCREFFEDNFQMLVCLLWTSKNSSMSCNLKLKFEDHT